MADMLRYIEPVAGTGAVAPLQFNQQLPVEAADIEDARALGLDAFTNEVGDAGMHALHRVPLENDVICLAVRGVVAACIDFWESGRDALIRHEDRAARRALGQGGGLDRGHLGILMAVEAVADCMKASGARATDGA